MKVIQDDVAIVGMAGLFADAPDVRTFWENILAQHCSISDHPDPDAYRHLDPQAHTFERVYTLRGGYLKELARFDPLAHGVLPLTVPTGDADQFLAISTATQAIKDAGLDDATLPRDRTAVILGHGSYFNSGSMLWFQRGHSLDLTLKLLRQLLPDLPEAEIERLRGYLDRSIPPIDAATAPTLIPNLIAGRIANRLDFMGASYLVDGACASSTIAIDHAMKELLLDRCDLALAGGVQGSVPVQEIMLFSSVGAISHQPTLRPFDKDADGTLLGEGVGMLVLKRRRDAERDGNRIYALVKSVGVASDGRARALMAPRLEGGALAVKRAYQYAQIDPATVGLIEAHGTGIPLGDRTEIGALRSSFGGRRGTQATTAVGSVKSNIGHCRPAAGIAGVIKATLALYHRVLPPTANCPAPHPDLDLGQTPFYINNEARPWIHGAPDHPRRAGINAMGFGGIDTHCVLEEYEGNRTS